ncbi:hypothetical protein FRC05_005826 [Tulasnella sp. 425]|nr:hypothetical protein FRC05_005826 [Tulasnella sp. 425]
MEQHNTPLFDIIGGPVIPDTGSMIHPIAAPPPQDLNSFTTSHIARLHSDAQEGEHAQTADALVTFLSGKLKGAKEETRTIRTELARELDATCQELALARAQLVAKEAEATARMTNTEQEWKALVRLPTATTIRPAHEEEAEDVADSDVDNPSTLARVLSAVDLSRHFGSLCIARFNH